MLLSNENPTEELSFRRISLKRLQDRELESTMKGFLGWEYAPPRIGDPYVIHFQGMVLKTSPVKIIQRTKDVTIIKTANSIYQVEYLREEETQAQFGRP